jgi:hypothetical protein
MLDTEANNILDTAVNMKMKYPRFSISLSDAGYRSEQYPGYGGKYANKIS